MQACSSLCPCSHRLLRLGSHATSAREVCLTRALWALRPCDVIHRNRCWRRSNAALRRPAGSASALDPKKTRSYGSVTDPSADRNSSPCGCKCRGWTKQMSRMVRRHGEPPDGHEYRGGLLVARGSPTRAGPGQTALPVLPRSARAGVLEIPRCSLESRIVLLCYLWPITRVLEPEHAEHLEEELLVDLPPEGGGAASFLRGENPAPAGERRRSGPPLPPAGRSRRSRAAAPLSGGRRRSAAGSGSSGRA